MSDIENAVKLPDGLTSDKVIQICVDRAKTFDGWFEKKFKGIKEARKSFHNVFDTTAKSTTAFPVPITYGNIETIFARLGDVVFGKEKTVDAMRIDGIEDDNEKKQRIEDFSNQEIRQKALAGAKGKHLVKSTLIDGIGIWRSTWKQVKKEYSEALYDDVDGQKMFMGRKEKEIKYEEFENENGEKEKREVEGEELAYFHEFWDFEQRLPENMGWEPSTKLDINNSPWVFDKDKMTLNQLIKMQELGQISNVEMLDEITPNELKATGGEATIESWKADKSKEHPYSDRNVYEVVEWWGELLWTSEEDGEKKHRWGNYHWFIVEGTVLIHFEENPLKPIRHPYHSCPAIIDPGQAVGLSVAATTKGVQRLLDRMAGKQVDLVDQSANVRTYYGQRSGLDGRTTFSKNNALIPVKDVGQIKESTPNIGAISSTQGFMNWLVGLMREISSANEQAQGVGGSDTATEFKGLLAAAGTRFKDLADTMATMINVNLAQECYWNYKENGIIGQIFVRDGGDEGGAVALLEEDFEGDYEFLPASQQTEFDKDKSFEGDVNFLTVMGTLSQQGALKTPFNYEKYLVDVMLPKKQVKNGGTYFEEPDPMAQMMPQNEAMLPQSGAMPQGLPQAPQGMI